jgi:hypothetical protein
MRESLFVISHIFLSPYLSLTLFLCSFLLYIVSFSNQKNNFPIERKIAKWGSIVYLSLGLISIITFWVAR